MGQTIAEKIISKHVGHEVKVGELVIAKVDVAAVQDGTGPLMCNEFKKLGKDKLDCTKNLTVNYTEEDCNKVVEKFKNAIDSINNLEFEPTYDQKVCKYCACADFCKGNEL